MIINMITGAHAELIPLITDLNNCDMSGAEDNSEEISRKLKAIFDYKTQNWVTDMVSEMINDFFKKLPEALVVNVAEKISDHPKLPLHVCLFLMDYAHDISVLMLEKALVLSDQDFVYRMNEFEIDELIAISRRNVLSEYMIQRLIGCEEPAVYLTLLRNPNICAKAQLAEIMVVKARTSPTAAWYVVNQTSARSVMMNSNQDVI